MRAVRCAPQRYRPYTGGEGGRDARSVSRSCSTAAAGAPIVGIRRVLASPGIGAFARIAMETGLLLGGGIAVASRELRRIGAKEIRQTQSPHQKHGTHRAMFFPPSC